MTQQKEEPWLRGTHVEIEPVVRSLIHSLEMAREDAAKWCGDLDDFEIHARPFQLPSIAFQLRHITRSLDRFLTYAQGRALSDGQMAALASEMDPQGSREDVFEEFTQGLDRTGQRLRAGAERPFDAPVKIGRKALPTTWGGLLVHAAEHTQRHVGQAITTAKIVVLERARVPGNRQK
jgi:uncharacterized damage-inducible protein DinB